MANLFQRRIARAPRFYLDMDGVLADYERGADEAGVAYDVFKDQPGAYQNLPIIPGASEAVVRLMERYGDSLWILSTPPSKRAEEATQEKREWLRKNFPNFPIDHALFSQNKAEEGLPGDTLVDDHPDWNGAVDFPGEVIQFHGPQTWENLLEPTSKTAAVDLEPLVTEFLSFLDPQGRFPRPSIKLVNRVNVQWLGLCSAGAVYLASDKTTCTGEASEILIQKGIVKNERLLRSVVAHEVGHHVAWNELIVGKSLRQAREDASKETEHGPQFMSVLQRLNDHYGENFVTVLCDISSNEFEKKEVFLFLLKRKGMPFINWMWDTKVPAQVVEHMKDVNSSGLASVRLTRTTNRFLVVPEAKGPYGWATPHNGGELDAVEIAWASGKDLFQEYASGLKPSRKAPEKRWTLVMVDPYRQGSDGAQGQPKWINAWAIARTLTAAELDTLSQLVTLGKRIRYRRIFGEEGLFSALPKFDINVVVYRPGIAGGDVMQVQQALMRHWGTSQQVEPKEPSLKEASAYTIDDGPGTEATVHCDLDNNIGPDFQITVRSAPHGGLEAEVSVVDHSGEANHGGKPYVVEVPYREGDLPTASDLILKIREVLNQEYSEAAYPLRQQGNRKRLKDLQMEFRNCYQRLMADLVGKLVRTPGNRWTGWGKTAGVWDADTERVHLREDQARVRAVQNTLRQHFQHLLDRLHVQPQGHSMTLRQFLQRNPLTELFRSTDYSVRSMGNRIRQEMDYVLHNEFRPEDIQRFKNTFGANVTDWFTHRVISRSILGARQSMNGLTGESREDRIYEDPLED